MLSIGIVIMPKAEHTLMNNMHVLRKSQMKNRFFLINSL
jgi:hypothetical protein